MKNPIAPDDDAGPLGDAEVMEQSLELAAERCDDLTPLVYDRFFEQRPEARDFFQLDDIDPRARGRMLAEILCLVIDSAKGEGYVPPTMSTIAADHVSYGVADIGLYTAFLDALREALSGLLGEDWTPVFSAAWERQCAALTRAIPARAAALAGS